MRAFLALFLQFYGYFRETHVVGSIWKIELLSGQHRYQGTFSRIFNLAQKQFQVSALTFSISYKWLLSKQLWIYLDNTILIQRHI